MTTSLTIHQDTVYHTSEADALTDIYQHLKCEVHEHPCHIEASQYTETDDDSYPSDIITECFYGYETENGMCLEMIHPETYRDIHAHTAERGYIWIDDDHGIQSETYPTISECEVDIEEHLRADHDHNHSNDPQPHDETSIAYEIHEDGQYLMSQTATCYTDANGFTHFTIQTTHSI